MTLKLWPVQPHTWADPGPSPENARKNLKVGK